MNEIEVLKYCVNYRSIINCDFSEDDELTKKIIEIYEEHIFKIDISDKKQVKFAKELDEAIKFYISDYRFEKELKNTLDIPSIVKKNFKLKQDLLVYIVEYYKEYKLKRIEKPVVTQWI